MTPTSHRPERWRREPLALVLAAAIALFPAAYLAISACSTGEPTAAGFESAFTRWSYDLIPWMMGAATFLALLGLGRASHRGAGVGLMSVPVWQTLWGILDSLVELQQGGFVFRAYTHHELSGLYLYKLVEDLGYLTLGFLVYNSEGRFSALVTQSPRVLARGLVRAGLPTGGRGEGTSALLGLAGFPVLLLTTIAINLALNRVDSLSQSDESSVFDNMTLFHAVMISLAAAFTEELTYRGILMVALSRRLPMLAAVMLQAVVFGLAHGGYGTWLHIIIAGLFGLVSGLVAWRLGLWAAIVLHALVDLFAFGADASSNVPWLWQAIVWAFLANCVFTLAFAGLWVLRQVEARKAPPVA